PQSGYCNIAASKVAVWGFHGGNDDQFPYQADAVDAAAVNNCSPIIPAVDTIIAGEGHGIFQTVVYDLYNGHHIPNVFQWMLKVNRGMNVVTNLPPVPVIAEGPIVGGNLVISLNAPVKEFTLDGSASHDDDDIIMDYWWQKAGIPSGLTPEDTIVVASAMWPKATVTASPAHLRIPAGDWNFKFRVRDYLTSAIYGSNNHTQIVNVTVKINYPDGSHSAPATDAGGSIIIPSDQTTVPGRVGQAEAYNCTDCNIVSYLWTQVSGPAATLSNYHDPGQPYPPGESAIAFTDLNSPGIYQFQFSATNNHGDVGSDIFTITKLGALPVAYAWFNGQSEGNKNVLEWATTSEVNSLRFDIDRSTDGIHFTVAGSVTAKGGASTTTYGFDDNNAVPGLTYYRLSQVDKDGKSSLSKTISVLNRKTGLYIEKYPNPVHDNLTVTIQGNTNGTMHVMIADMQGKAIIQLQWQKDQALLKKAVNVGALQNGVYQMIVTLGGDKQVSSFVKY
ncbi:MAG: T9SS type A sorting domain-containing protein, partial [Bacteroidota bacterium]